MNAIKPGTPLPWWCAATAGTGLSDDAYAVGHRDTELAHVMGGQDDARYIVHACNAYPRLVAALRALVDDAELGEVDLEPAEAAKLETARALLDSLGERA